MGFFHRRLPFFSQLSNMSRECRRGQIDAKDVLIPCTSCSQPCYTHHLDNCGALEMDASEVIKYRPLWQVHRIIWDVLRAEPYFPIRLLGFTGRCQLLPPALCRLSGDKWRKMPPTNFKESRFIAISLLSILEAFL